MYNRILFMFIGFVFVTCALGQRQSRYSLQRDLTRSSTDQVRLRVHINDDAHPNRKLPVRVSVTAADGSFSDGSGHGVYADGRFYVDGFFQMLLPVGPTKIELSSGPHYHPLSIEEDLKAGAEYLIQAKLKQWIAPEDWGWYCGDNHVHALHDKRALVKASLDYTALQGRANGLNWITEAGSNVPYDKIDQLDTPTFLLRYAKEQRPGAYIGHVNTPGISAPLKEDRLQRILQQPLPVQALKEYAHELGGVVIHTHPLVPPHQLHWMGATEFLSDMVMGRCADLLDIDSRATEYLWFMALNLGNRVGACGSTDSALGRRRTRSPGDRRVYVQAETFSYSEIVKGLRQGRTFATNGKGILPLFRIGAHQPGDSIPLKGSQDFTAKMIIHTRDGVRTAQLYRNGIRIWAKNLSGLDGPIELEKSIKESETCWFVLRVEDHRGNWAITSPIYFRTDSNDKPSDAHAILFEISNCTRFVELRKEFYAHIITTVAPDETIRSIELLKDGKVLKEFRSNQGNYSQHNRVPVTQLFGEYQEGWIWYPNPKKPIHFQADYPIQETGWYAVRFFTDLGTIKTSKRIHFDASHPKSRAISYAQVKGSGSSLEWYGYGEEMALKGIKLPFEGDAWWYPQNPYWQIRVGFGKGPQHIGGGWDQAKYLFD